MLENLNVVANRETMTIRISGVRWQGTCDIKYKLDERWGRIKQNKTDTHIKKQKNATKFSCIFLFKV